MADSFIPLLKSAVFAGLKGCAVGICGAACLSRTYRDTAGAAAVLTCVIGAVLDVADYALDML